MNDLFWLSEVPTCRIKRYFPLSHGVPKVDDRSALSGIVFVIRNGGNGLRWRDAPVGYGPHKTMASQAVIEQLPGWLAHYNDVHPHRALGYRSLREYLTKTRKALSGL